MLIGIYSSTAGSGKSSIAGHLVTHYGFTHLSFAEPLKAMVGTLLREFGYSLQDAHHMTHVAKSAPIPEIDDRLDARHLLRTLGTEWGRDCVHPELWLRCWTFRYMQLQLQGAKRVVVDDMRFPNEAALLDRFGGQLWKVNRPEADAGSAPFGGSCLKNSVGASPGRFRNRRSLVTTTVDLPGIGTISSVVSTPAHISTRQCIG